MQKQDQFILLTVEEFYNWINEQKFNRTIKLIQNHHTFQPNYSGFDGKNHFARLKSMREFHINVRGFSDIAQNITIFPDGLIAICRPFDVAPAGIKGANSYGICIENFGNFDIDGDIMTDEHKESIVACNAILLKRFGLPINTDTVVYHHWYDLTTGKKTMGSGTTKSCPGTNFFGGNKVSDCTMNFLPLIANYQ